MVKNLLAALALTTALTAAGPTMAGPALAAVGAFAVTPIGGVVINLGIGIGASLIQNALKPKETETEASQRKFGMQLNMKVGSNQPIAFPVGYTVTGGNLLYPGTWGTSGDTPNAYAVWEIELSYIPLVDNPVLWWNEQKVTIDWNATPTTQGYPVLEARKKGKDHLWVRFQKGDQSTASSYMVGKFGTHPNRPYTSAMVGRGLAKVQITALWNPEIFQTDPTFLWETTGIALYNIAKDSSVGGSGTHRWNDSSTWEPSSNAMVIAYNIWRGIFYNGEWVYGGRNKKELNAHRLPAAAWIAAINACATSIDLKGGGTEPQFRAGGVITGDMPSIEVMQQLLNSANGFMSDVGGLYKPFVGAPGSSVYSFTDGDVVVTESQNYRPFPDLGSIHNAIEADYPEPGKKWEMIPAPGRYDTIWEAEDGGRRLTANVSFPLVPYRYQVQRLMKAIINDGRKFRLHSMTLPPSAWMIEPGETVTWTSAQNGYTAKKFTLMARYGSSGFRQRAIVREIDPNDHDWVPNSDTYTVVVPTLSIQYPPVQTISSFSAIGAKRSTQGGSEWFPTIRVGYAAGLSDVATVSIEVRESWGSKNLIHTQTVVYDTEATSNNVWLDGLFEPTKDYEVRAKFNTKSGRASVWTNQDTEGVDGAWLAVTIPSGSALPPGTVTQSELNQHLKDAFNVIIGDAGTPGTLAAYVTGLQNNINSVAGNLTTAVTGLNDRIDQVNSVNVDGAVAAALSGFINGQYADDQQATAIAIQTSATETLNGLGAGLFSVRVVGTPTSTHVQLALMARITTNDPTEDGDVFVQSGILIDLQKVNGKITSQIVYAANKQYWADDTGNVAVAPMQFINGELTLTLARMLKLRAGVLTSDDDTSQPSDTDYLSRTGSRYIFLSGPRRGDVRL